MLNQKKIQKLFHVENLIKWALAIIALVIAAFPVWWMINVVFTESGVPVSINPRLYPTSLFAGIEKIIKVLSESQYLHSYFVSVVYTILTIIGSILICSMAAFEFALFEFPGKKVLFALVLLSLMIPAAVTLIPTYLLVVDLGWLNTMQGLVVPGLASAFGLFMLTQFLQDIPREIIDAGLIDGVSHFGLYRYIIMPLSKNALFTLAILVFIRTWGNFIWPLVIATKPEIYTVSQIVNWYNSPMSYTTVDIVMTANLLAAVLPLVFYFVFQRFVIEAVTQSGIKG